jgi:hypothetical protein
MSKLRYIVCKKISCVAIVLGTPSEVGVCKFMDARVKTRP